MFGGRSRSDAATTTDAVWRYEPDLGLWTAEPRLPQPRAHLAAVVLEDGIHVVGGLDREQRAGTNHWVFDPNPNRLNRWADAQPPLPPPGRAGLAAFSVLDRVYVVSGGWDSASDTLTWVPGEDWRHEDSILPNPVGAPGLAQPEARFGLVAYRSGAVVLVGGQAADGSPVATHLRFDPRWSRVFIGGAPVR